MDSHLIFAKASWILLIIILYMRPLAKITGWKKLRQLMPLRKHLGIACGFAALLHVTIYLIGSELITTYFLDGTFWSFTNLFGWGNIALLALLIPFFTSNRISQIYFKSRWKKLQLFAYPAFIFTGIHVSLARHDFLVGIVPVVIWAILWCSVEIRKTYSVQK